MRCHTYCPKMDQDFENWVKSCRGCVLAAKSIFLLTHDKKLIARGENLSYVTLYFIQLGTYSVGVMGTSSECGPYILMCNGWERLPTSSLGWVFIYHTVTSNACIPGDHMYLYLAVRRSPGFSEGHWRQNLFQHDMRWGTYNDKATESINPPCRLAENWALYRSF